MGYSTKFKGELKFATEPTAAQLAELKKWLGEDVREHGYANIHGQYAHHLDLELTDDFTGVRWNGAEKTYSMEEVVNFITARMREQWPDFAFTGTLEAWGEEPGDVWKLVIREGAAVKETVGKRGRRD